MLGKKKNGVTGLIGAVCNDDSAKLYKEFLSKEQILPLFEKLEASMTGLCLVYCKNSERGHITDLGASCEISYNFVEKTIKKFHWAKLIYTDLFMLKYKKEIIYLLAKFGLEENKLFGFNLPSFSFIKNSIDDIKSLFEYADVVFSNLAEAKYFARMIKGTEVRWL